MTSSNDTACPEMTGAQIVIQALKDNGVEHIFGIPGGAVLPIYDELFQQDDIKHILVRHEQGAGHAAEGMSARPARSASCSSHRDPASPIRSPRFRTR
jgi:acetolactate synthase-1/2/3 large subunit